MNCHVHTCDERGMNGEKQHGRKKMTAATQIAVRVKQALGYSLVEMLLVIAIAAVLITLGIRHYRFYQQQRQLATLDSKIHTLQWALNRYFHQQGCFRGGVFRGNYQPTISKDLLYDINPDIKKSFMPDNWVQAYAVSIVDTLATTGLKQPLYKLQLTITLSPGVDAKQAQWLYQRLQANKMQGQELIWSMLPGNTISEPGNGLWILSASREQFRQSEQDRSQYIIHLQNAYSYCAH